jgi:hypothetical protein
MYKWILVALVLLAGCATTQSRRLSETQLLEKVEEYNAALTDPNEKIVCERVRPTGSNVPELVCRTSRMAQIDRDNARNFFDTHTFTPQPGGN